MCMYSKSVLSTKCKLVHGFLFFAYKLYNSNFSVKNIFFSTIYIYVIAKSCMAYVQTI